MKTVELDDLMKYAEPDRTYDDSLVADEAYVETLPDLQNGPSSLIQGSKVAIKQVGIHNFRIPIMFSVKGDGPITLETSITGSVSLEAFKKGINMSRIMRNFYTFKDHVFSIDKIKEILHVYQNELESFDAKVMMKFSYPIIQKSLRSDNEGYQYYNVTFEGDLDKDGKFRKFIHFDFVYSSACPCSYELGQHALENRNKAVVPHSQRSVARISVLVKNDEFLWIEDLHEHCLNALRTETQVIVKREDEQAFAELNASSLKFVEDAVRLLHEQISQDKRILDYRIIASHQESLHSHDAVAVIAKGIDGGFESHVSREEWSSLIHVPR